MTTQEKLQSVQNAGFVKAQTTAIVPADRPRTYHDNYSTTHYFHRTVLDMPAEEQAEQPWIEHIVWVASHLKDNPDIVEGRFGACRYPIRCLNDLHLFMRNFGYTYLPDEADQSSLPAINHAATSRQTRRYDSRVSRATGCV